MIPFTILCYLLQRSAAAILDKHRPTVVGVSGSVGKTSAKDAVACVLGQWRPTICSPENQNDELGVPLSVIGARPGVNALGWLTALRRGRRLASLPRGSYPQCLVLEFGSCHVGDVEALMTLTSPEVGVLTGIEATHLASYGSLDAIEREEGKVVTMLPSAGVGVVNLDNAGAARAAERASCRIVTYGFDAAAEVRGTAAVSTIDWDRLTSRVTLDVRSSGTSASLTIEGTVGAHSCYAPLAALAVARAVGIPLPEASRALRAYVPPRGRMRCAPGLGGSMIVDDSYNSSPVAARKALDTLATLPRLAGAKRIAVLGPMAELGAASEREHADIGHHAARLGIDRVFTVGDAAKATARAARDAGVPEAHARSFTTVEQAIDALRDCTRAGDVVLVKGSQAARMDRIVPALV